MPRYRRRFEVTPRLESLEQRALLATVPLPGAGSAWAANGITFVGAPLIADLDPAGTDAREEVIVTGGDNKLYAYRSQNGAYVQVRSFDTGPQGGQIQATPVLTTLADGRKALFAGTVNGLIYGWDAATGGLLPGWPQSTLARFGGVVVGLAPSVYGALTAADLDGDRSPEIVTTSIGQTVSAFRANGELFWQFNNDDSIFGSAAVGDLDRDGLLEVVFGGDSSAGDFYKAGGRIVALSFDGRRKWVRDTEQIIASSPVLADLDADGYLDVVVGTGFFYGSAADGTTNNYIGNRIYALDRFGRDLPGWPYVTAANNSDGRVIGSPAIADMDRDGFLDVVAVDNSSRIHVVNRLGQALRIGSALSTPQPFFSSPIIVDVGGDGDLDVVVSSSIEVNAYDPFDGPNGRLTNLGRDLNASYGATPAVGKLAGDGSRTLVALANTIVGGQLRSPSFFNTFELGTSRLDDPWPMIRRDASNTAVVRHDPVSSQLITRLYEVALGRSPSDQELNGFWVPYFRGAPSFLASIRGIVSSQEARQVRIQGFYQRYINRSVDPTGLQTWQEFLASGQDDSFIQASIVGSEEVYANAGGTPQSWVTRLYQLVLNRDPVGGEEALWVNTLTADPGAKRQIAFGFLESQELSDQQVRTWFAQYAPGGQTSPTPEVLKAASWDLRRGLTEEIVLGNLLDSGGDYLVSHPEGSWLRAMYRDALGREASPAELITWLHQFELGSNFEVAGRQILYSAEYFDRLVAGWYQTYLGRGSTQPERLPLVVQLVSGVSSQVLLRDLLAGSEYYQRAGGTLNGYLNRVFVDILGRGPTPEQVAGVAGQPADSVRSNVADFLLKSPEYAFNNLQNVFFHYLRRFSYTPLDQSAVGRPGLDVQAAVKPFVDFMVAGGTLEQVQLILLTAPEYRGLTRTKALWTLDPARNLSRWTVRSPARSSLPFDLPN